MNYKYLEIASVGHNVHNKSDFQFSFTICREIKDCRMRVFTPVLFGQGYAL